MRGMRRFKIALVWLIIALIVGAAGGLLFHLNFWVSSLVAGAALVVNGLIAEWEDRNGN